MAACWLLAALLRWLGTVPLSAATTYLALDSLAPAYGMLRGVATTALRHVAPPVAVAGLLRPSYVLLRGAVASDAGLAAQAPEELAQAAAAVLALGGLAEALRRSAAGFPEAAQLAADAEADLLAACATAETAAAVSQAAAAALLQDACSLAGAQLFAVWRPGQAPSASLAVCQARSLLQSALDLGPLLRAAKAAMPPAQASEQLRRQVGSALGQHTASLASGLAAQLPLLDGGAQHRLVQQVAAAGWQAYQQYRELALAVPPDWLAGLDAAALRPLLDRLFLSCLALLAAAWDAAPAAAAAGTAAATVRARLAASVAGVLADLQFCRLGAAQYASLLRAVLPEVASDPAAAASLAACLPYYADLAAPCPARGGAPAWLVDGVAAAKVQFLFNALVPCCAALAEVRDAEGTAALRRASCLPLHSRRRRCLARRRRPHLQFHLFTGRRRACNRPRRRIFHPRRRAASRERRAPPRCFLWRLEPWGPPLRTWRARLR